MACFSLIPLILMNKNIRINSLPIILETPPKKDFTSVSPLKVTEIGLP